MVDKSVVCKLNEFYYKDIASKSVINARSTSNTVELQENNTYAGSVKNLS